MSLNDQFMYGVLALKVYRCLDSVQISTEIHGTLICPLVWRYRTVVDSMLCITFLVAVSLWLKGGNYKQRCRTASNNITAAAALTLSDSIVPLSGMANCTSHILSTSLEMPVSSLPSTRAVGRVRSAR